MCVEMPFLKKYFELILSLRMLLPCSESTLYKRNSNLTLYTIYLCSLSEVNITLSLHSGTSGQGHNYAYVRKGLGIYLENCEKPAATQD